MEAPVTMATLTSLEAAVPDGALSGKVSVTSLGGSAESAGDFLVVPQVSGFAPLAVLPGGTLTIQGIGFDPDPAKTAVSVGGLPASVTGASYNDLTVEIPSLRRQKNG